MDKQIYIRIYSGENGWRCYKKTFFTRAALLRDLEAMQKKSHGIITICNQQTGKVRDFDTASYAYGYISKNW